MKAKIIIILLNIAGICNSQIVNIPDVIFKNLLINSNTTCSIATHITNINTGAFILVKVDANSDGEIQQSEANYVTGLTIDPNGCNFQTLSNLNSLSGIEQFTYLSNLRIHQTQITTLNLNNLYNLSSLVLTNNNLLSTINLFGVNNLNNLTCSGHPLLNTLDLSNKPDLYNIAIYTNNLNTINLKTGGSMTSLNFQNNPNIQYICVNDNQLSFVQNKIIQYGYSNISLNSYCSFSPATSFYNVNGTFKYDADSNGCNALDINCPNFTLRFNGNNYDTYGNFISNLTGNYSTNLVAGTYTISPSITENTSYFTINPTSSNITFPTTTSPATRNFCITANGVHNDLEVVLLPISSARPGFDTNYSLVYKNKGTNTQSGNINLNFNDLVLDLTSTNPSTSSQTQNNLSWNFSDLLPFETREILITLNLNSPSETPPVNSGYLLNFETTITGLIDETPLDNLTSLNQTVINSFDPNDKNCLEGLTITPDKVGNFVHYIIRFENNGTANAQNIVVKDIIDINKYDVSTLTPISGSHPFITRKSNTNQIEFIFENINLPFTDSTNDGYVAFKIKTKPTLVLGNTFSNIASIYFDYNLPIVTNNYITTIQNSLSNNQFLNNSISIFPNPVKDILQFKMTEKVLKVEVYDITGRVLSSNSINENVLNLIELKTGNYILKVFTEKGIHNTKIIKE